MLAQDELALLGRRGGGELEHQRQVVGQLATLELEAGGAVELLQPQQRQAALAAVAERVEGQIQRGALVQVERLHVVLRELERRASRVNQAKKRSERIRRRPDREAPPRRPRAPSRPATSSSSGYCSASEQSL